MPNKSYPLRKIAATVFGAAILFACSAGLGAASGQTVPVRPTWHDLTPAQQHALAPMQAEWDSFDSMRKRKWIEFAAKYDRMTAQEQTRVQERMRGWALLSPAERQKARDSFKQTRNLPVEKRQRAWEEYQSLTPEERQRLEEETKRRQHPKAASPKPTAPKAASQGKTGAPKESVTAKPQPPAPTRTGS